MSSEIRGESWSADSGDPKVLPVSSVFTKSSVFWKHRIVWQTSHWSPSPWKSADFAVKQAKGKPRGFQTEIAMVVGVHFVCEHDGVQCKILLPVFFCRVDQMQVKFAGVCIVELVILVHDSGSLVWASSFGECPPISIGESGICEERHEAIGKSVSHKAKSMVEIGHQDEGFVVSNLTMRCACNCVLRQRLAALAQIKVLLRKHVSRMSICVSFDGFVLVEQSSAMHILIGSQQLFGEFLNWWWVRCRRNQWNIWWGRIATAARDRDVSG